MARNETKEEISEVEEIRKKICSICKKDVPQGQYYIRDITSNEIICSNCDDGQAPIKGDILFSID